MAGKAICKNILGKTQAEVKAKLRAAIEKNDTISLRTEQYTLGQWLNAWMEN